MNEGERYLFDLNGFITVPNALPQEQIDALNHAIDEHIQKDKNPKALDFGFGNVLDWRGPMLDLIDHAPMMPYVETLCGPYFRLDHAYVTVIRPGAVSAGAWHLHGGGTPYDPDHSYHVRDGRMFNGLIVVAYNLTDVNPGDGGLGCFAGSHKANFKMPKDWFDLRNPHPAVTAVTGKTGTAVLFTEALTHGTLPWKGKQERRTVFFKYNQHYSAYSNHYLDKASETFSELTPRQREILEAPSARSDQYQKAKEAAKARALAAV